VPFTVNPRNVPEERTTIGEAAINGTNSRNNMRSFISRVDRKGDSESVEE